MTFLIKLSEAENCLIFSPCPLYCSCFISKNSQSSVLYERRWIVWDSNINGGCDLHGLLKLVPNQSTAPPLWPSCPFLLLSLSCQSQFITLAPVSLLPKNSYRVRLFRVGLKKKKKKFVFEHFREERKNSVKMNRTFKRGLPWNLFFCCSHAVFMFELNFCWLCFGSFPLTNQGQS